MHSLPLLISLTLAAAMSAQVPKQVQLGTTDVRYLLVSGDVIRAAAQGRVVEHDPREEKTRDPRYRRSGVWQEAAHQHVELANRVCATTDSPPQELKAPASERPTRHHRVPGRYRRSTTGSHDLSLHGVEQLVLLLHRQKATLN